VDVGVVIVGVVVVVSIVAVDVGVVIVGVVVVVSIVAVVSDVVVVSVVVIGDAVDKVIVLFVEDEIVLDRAFRIVDEDVGSGEVVVVGKLTRREHKVAASKLNAMGMHIKDKDPPKLT